MQSGEFIVDRWMPDILRDICKKHSISVRSFSDDWIFQFSKGGRTSFVIGYKFALNDAASAGIAQDKVATYELLRVLNVPVVPHVLVRTKATDSSGWKQQKWEQFVIKPLIGTSGHGVRLFHDIALAEDWMQRAGIEAWTVSPYLAIERETRLVVLDGDILIAYDKQPVMIHGLKMFNLGKGAVPQVITPSSEMIAIARAAASGLGLRLCAVDIVALEDGTIQVLEVNEGLMLEHFMRHSPGNKRIAYEIYEKIVREMIG